MKLSASRLIKAPKQRVWTIVADLANWGNWSTLSATNRVVSHSIVSKEGNVVVCDEQEKAGFISARHRNRYTLYPDERLEEEVIEGDVTGKLTLTLKITREGTFVEVAGEVYPRSLWLRFLLRLFGGERVLKMFWTDLFDQLSSLAESDCSPEQPMYCPSKMLDPYFEMASLPMQGLVNTGKRELIIQSRTVYNDKYWKGIYPPDSLIPAWIFQNGFNKRFWLEEGSVKGVTSTFDDNIKGGNTLRPLDPSNPSKGILLEYVEPQFSMFYDVLKLVSEDIVVGKAFTGKYPNGRLLMNFTMARRYSFDFMSAEDHRELFEKYGRVPDTSKITGEWQGRMVSNASLTPPLFRFWYAVDSNGKVSCKWNFMQILKGSSRIELTPDQLLMFDFTNFHDEIRMISDDVMVGRYLPQSNEILNTIGDRSLGLVHFEKSDGGTRPMIYYYIRKVTKSF